MRILTTVTVACAALVLAACTGPEVTPTPVTPAGPTSTASTEPSTPASSTPSAPDTSEPPSPAVSDGAAGELLSAANGLGFACLDGYSDQHVFLVSCEFGRSAESNGLPIGLLDAMFSADGKPQAFALRFIDQYNQSSDAGKAGSQALPQESHDALARVSDILLPDEQATAIQADPYLLVSPWGQVGTIIDPLLGESGGGFHGWHAAVADAPQLPPAATLPTRELIAVRDALRLPDTCIPTMGCKLTNGMEFFFGAEAMVSSTLLVAYGEADAGTPARQRSGGAAQAIEPLLGDGVREAVLDYAAAKVVVTEAGHDLRTIGGLELTFGVGEFRAQPLDGIWATDPPPEESRAVAERVAEVFASGKDDAAIRKALALPASAKVSAPGGLKPMERMNERGWQYTNPTLGQWSHTWETDGGMLTVTVEHDQIVELQQT